MGHGISDRRLSRTADCQQASPKSHKTSCRLCCSTQQSALAFMSTKAAAGKFIRKETIWALSERILESNLSLSYMILELIYFSEISQNIRIQRYDVVVFVYLYRKVTLVIQYEPQYKCNAPTQNKIGNRAQLYNIFTTFMQFTKKVPEIKPSQIKNVDLRK